MSLHVTDIVQAFEEWAPRWAAWEKIRRPASWESTANVKKILITLDVTKQIVAEAIAKKTELIISHHPLLFRPQSSITTSDTVGELVLQLAETRFPFFLHILILIYTSGVSFALAEYLD